MSTIGLDLGTITLGIAISRTWLIAGPYTILKYQDENDFNKRLKSFDDELFNNHENPGTTADLTAATIMLYYLSCEFEN